MRTRYLVSLTIFLITCLLLILRQHIRDLGEVARTYSTFHKYLQHNPHVLLRYPAALQSQDQDLLLPTPVPKIIHQIFLSDGQTNASLSKYEPAINSCEALHPGWVFRMWDDEAARVFMAEFYPDIFPHYVGYKQNIQRANILRYALLHHFGGVYLDLDVTCIVPLDEPLSENDPMSSLVHLPWVTPGAYPAGVNNAFILSRPGHPFLTQLLERVPSRDLKWPMPYVENMLSTGCMYFSNVWMSFALRLEREWGKPGVRKDDRVYILADEDGEMEGHMLRGKVTTPLFTHGGASSWHGWDAALIVLVGKHYGYFLVLVGLGIALSVGMAWTLTRWSRGGVRRSGRVAHWRRNMPWRNMDTHRLLSDQEEDVEKNG